MFLNERMCHLVNSLTPLHVAYRKMLMRLDLRLFSNRSRIGDLEGDKSSDLACITLKFHCFGLKYLTFLLLFFFWFLMSLEVQ